MRKQLAVALATAFMLAGGSALAQYQQTQQMQQPQQSMQGQQNMQGQQTQRPKAASTKKTKHKMSSAKKHHRVAAKSKGRQTTGMASSKSKSLKQPRSSTETTGTGPSQQPKSTAPSSGGSRY